MLPLRLRCPTNSAPQQLSLPLSATWEEAFRAISEASRVEESKMRILSGFPPKPVEPSSQSITLQEMKLRPNEMLTIQEGEPRIQLINTGERYVPLSHERAHFRRRYVPADNSCLFHSCAYVLLNRSRTDGPSIRQRCIDYVLANPQRLKEVGEDPIKYIAFLSNPNNWGGHIEISFLSEMFETEIIVLDLSSHSIIPCGSVQEYPTVAFIAYTGQHYDAVAMSTASNLMDETHDQVLFNRRDKAVFQRAKEFLDEGLTAS